MASKKKSTAKKTPARKASAKKAPAKKSAAKKPAAGKKQVKVKKRAAAPTKTKMNSKKRATGTAKIAARKTSSTGARPSSGRAGGKHLSARELRDFEQLLLNLRDRVVDEISFLAGDNLSSVQMERTGEEGTDNFNREFALKLVSSEQDIIYEIDEALDRIRQGTYGICEISGEPIERERLKVMPHARHSVKVQSELEKGRARYRPFGPSIPRG